jgi:hypothetical protein
MATSVFRGTADAYARARAAATPKTTSPFSRSTEAGPKSDEEKLNAPDDMMREYVSGGSPQRQAADRKWDLEYAKARGDSKAGANAWAAKDPDQIEANTREAYNTSRRAGGREDAFSAEEFSALTPEQQGVATAQKQLWDAVLADKADNAAMGAGERKRALGNEEYQSTINTLFSKDGGSDTYAPRTAALLSILGQGDKAADIDDYLSGVAFLTKDELRNQPLQSVAETAPVQARAGSTLRGTVASNEQIADILLRGQSLLGGSYSDRSTPAFASNFAPKDPLQGLNEEQSAFLDSLLVDMSRRNTPADFKAKADLLESSYGITPDIFNAYVDKATKDIPDSGMDDPEFLSPSQFRERWLS